MLFVPDPQPRKTLESSPYVTGEELRSREMLSSSRTRSKSLAEMRIQASSPDSQTNISSRILHSTPPSLSVASVLFPPPGDFQELFYLQPEGMRQIMPSSQHGVLGELGNGAQCTSDSLCTPQSEGRTHGNLTYFPFILSISLHGGKVLSPSQVM